ncbi:gag/pol/env polyprotein, putative [Perkinsus marinus ATCC 50983]|uniref:Gag/pol/env polyprotein, putative n=1 Tax=Perkinsus marinus (strain ATCC 50983 / TXsc) TaxID=423536 RepID=C5LG60_PERM5|nr:gag/pol/env polyprotein, putative [Perkinsus marinus ATCC 50983]EER04315.1 gag/pol/env polyprotein, putative [Perkinsus marinus ATCC 50983]|eukprot:XP_002772499.1 gag/pol/env polyprotein, putative [Perkinsus marinus ATCC 50983]
MSTGLSLVDSGNRRPQRSCVGLGVERFADSSHSTGIHQALSSGDHNTAAPYADHPNNPDNGSPRSVDDGIASSPDDGVSASQSSHRDATSSPSRRDGAMSIPSLCEDGNHHRSSPSDESPVPGSPPPNVWVPPPDAMRETIHVNGSDLHLRQPPSQSIPHRSYVDVGEVGSASANHSVQTTAEHFAKLASLYPPFAMPDLNFYGYQRPLYHVGLPGPSPITSGSMMTYPPTPSFGIGYHQQHRLQPPQPSSSLLGLNKSSNNTPPWDVPAANLVRPTSAGKPHAEVRKRSSHHPYRRRHRKRFSRSPSSSLSDSGSSISRTLSSASASSSGSESEPFGRDRRHYKRPRSIGKSDHQRRVGHGKWCGACHGSKCRQKISLSDLNTLHNIARKRKGADKFLGHKDRRSGATWVAIIKRTMKGYPDAAVYLWAELNCDDSVWRDITAGRKAPTMCHADYSDHLTSLYRRVNTLYNNEEVRLRAEDQLHNLQQAANEDVASLLDRAETIRVELVNLGSEPSDRDMKRKIFDALHSERLRDRIDDYLSDHRVSLRRFTRKLLEQDSRQRHRDRRHAASRSGPSTQLNVANASCLVSSGTTASAPLPIGTTTPPSLPGGMTTSSFLSGNATAPTLAIRTGSEHPTTLPQHVVTTLSAGQCQPSRKGPGSTAQYLDPSALRPSIPVGSSTVDPKQFTIEFVRRFRCQRCLAHDHSTSKCGTEKMFMSQVRCDKCGLYHDVAPNPVLHCAKAICHRCSAPGHLCRACPSPKPQRGQPREQLPSSTAQVNCVSKEPTATSSLITIGLKISLSEDSRSATVFCPGLLDTGAEAFFLRSDELSSWRAAGLQFPILPDDTKVKVANGASVSTLGRTPPLRVTFVTGTTILASFLVLEDLTHRIILPTTALRQAGGARWVIGETPSEDRLFIGGGHVQQHFVPLAASGSTTCLRMVLARDSPSPTHKRSVKFSVLQDESENLCHSADPIDHDVSSTEGRHFLPVSYRPDPSAPAGRPYIGIPWCDDRHRPAWNYHRAYARDRAIFSRLTTEQQGLYRQAVTDLVTAGFAEVVENPEQCGYYINGLPVFRPDKATHRCRVCLDARELNRYIANISTKGVGPGSLWFFLIAVRNCGFFRAADLQTAFLRVGIQDSDSFFIGCVAASVTIRFRRLPFGLSCSGFGLESVLQDLQLRWSRQLAARHSPSNGLYPTTDGSLVKPGTRPLDTPPEAVPLCSVPKVLVDKGLDLVIYVDDLVNRGECPADVHNRSLFCYSKLDDAGMPVHEVKTFDNMHPAPSHDPTNIKGLLGYRYDPGSDSLSLTVKLEPTYSPETCTRRLLVGAVNSFYDPLNLFMEFAAVGRGLARLASQPTNTKSPSWDAPLDNILVKNLNQWISYIPREFWIPRFAGLHDGLYAFSDASYDGFCCDIRMGKFPFTRIGGRFGLFSLECVHKHSIVQKELSGLYCTITLLERLLDVATAHGPLPPSCDIFTDSLIAVHRLRSTANDNKLGIFERRRLRRVREFVTRAQKLGIVTHVRHIAGAYNPSDPCTRPFREPVELTPLPPDQISIGVSSSLTSDLTYPRQLPSRPAENDGDDLDPDPFPLIDYSDSEASCELNLVTTVSSPETDVGFVSVEELQADQSSCSSIRTIKEKLSTKTEDPTRQRLSNWYRIGVNGLLVRILSAKISDEDSPVVERIEQVLVGSEPLKHKLVEKAHDAFHRGEGGTLRLLCSRYFWKRMRAYVRRYVNRCDACAKAKGDRIARCSLGSVPWCGGVGPLRVVMIDYSGPYENGQDPSYDRYAVTIVCVATRYCRGVTVPDKSCATLLLKLAALFDSTDWPSLILASDSTFRGHQWTHFCASNNVIFKELPANAPFLLGSGERPHKEVNGYMRVILGKLGSGTLALSWVRHYFHGLRAWNLLPLPGTDIAPHDLVYFTRGRIPALDPIDDSAAHQVYQGLPSVTSAVSLDILTDIQNVKVSRWQQYRQVWLDLRERVRSTMATRVPPLNLSPGDWVYVWGHPRTKLSFRWKGPFEVISASPGSTIITVIDDRGTELLCARDNCKTARATVENSTVRGFPTAEDSPSVRDLSTDEDSLAPQQDHSAAEDSTAANCAFPAVEDSPLAHQDPRAGEDPVTASRDNVVGMGTSRQLTVATDDVSFIADPTTSMAPRHRPSGLGSLHIGMDVVAFYVPVNDTLGDNPQDAGRWYFGRLLNVDEEIPIIVIAPYCRRSDGLPVRNGEEYLATDSYLDHTSPTVIDLRSSLTVVRRITRATLRMIAAEGDHDD